MGACGSRPGLEEGPGAGHPTADGSTPPAAGTNMATSTWQLQAKMSTAAEMNGFQAHKTDLQLLGLGPRAERGGASAVTPVQAFEPDHSSTTSLPTPLHPAPDNPHHPGSRPGPPSPGLADRLFKRAPKPPAQPRPAPLPDAPPPTHRRPGAVPSLTIAPRTTASPTTPTTLTSRSQTSPSSGGGAPSVHSAPQPAAVQFALPAAAAAAAAVPRCDNVAQTDGSLLAALLRDPGPTVPVRWRKGEGIGAGSFGQVYLALNCDTGELLAVKEVPAGLAAEAGTPTGPQPGGGARGGGGGNGGGAAEAVAQLEREVSLLSGLRHPNIVRYVGTQRCGSGGGAGGGGGGGAGGGAGPPLYIFLEYVPGGSLSSQLARFGPLPEPLVALYTRQLLAGLAYLHGQRTVHRDIKGANLLLEKTGVLKLADFGMAKQLMEQVSFTRSFKGSAHWMAPEVIRQQGYGVAADIWSVGCTVLEMATGRPPWSQCTSQVQAIFKIASSSDLPAIPDHLSPPASEFILLCLQRDASARPSADQLLRHPFVTAPLSRTPLPPALADPLAAFTFDPPPPAATAAATRSAVSAGTGGLIRAGGSSHVLNGFGVGAAGGGGGSPGGALAGPRVGSVAAAAPAGGAAAWGTFGALGATPTAAGALALSLAAPMYGAGGLDALALGNGGAAAAAALYGVGAGGAAAGTGAVLDEDQLAALVLGSSVHVSKAARAAAAMAADEEREDAEDDAHIDFSAPPQPFRVRGLLSLPPLSALAGGQLPPLGLAPQAVPSGAAEAAGGGGREEHGGGGRR